MKALVLEEKDRLALRDIALEEKLGPRDVRISLRTSASAAATCTTTPTAASARSW